jgi:PAS domain S-box-containing protein
VRYISPSVEPILGYTQDELIGVSDIANTAPEHKDTVKQMFTQLAQYPDETISIQFKYRKKDGTFVWLEATGTNLLDDQAIKGLLVNSRDITERRRAEKEARMRGQMQSLSENSPDLIMRLNAEGKVFYINPTIKALTGLRPEHFLERNIRDASLKKEIIKFWLGLTEQAVKKGEAVNAEMHFPALREELIMQMNVLPEYNDNKEVESVLIVAHDITERKRTEIQIRDTNRKISESINYAQRIQGAILPDNEYIRRFLPDSFVFYRPRDVVSGDFPWFIRKNEDEIFIAAVDCTGHGVPGALISLIGYFLLNTIVRERQEVLPGEMLDLLNAEVTQTLRQDDENSNTKDGMDIALAKINFETQTLDYSGAHRPLYLLSDGELHQTKGDRFPIGGGSKHYRKRVNFTNHHISLKKGDTFYMFSDGLPDQFGGPENRKYSPRQIRDLIQRNASLSMEEMEQEFAKSLDTWQGEQKQTDDILMIGIRF